MLSDCGLDCPVSGGQCPVSRVQCVCVAPSLALSLSRSVRVCVVASGKWQAYPCESDISAGGRAVSASVGVSMSVISLRVSGQCDITEQVAVWQCGPLSHLIR